ncbi:MAG: hypothetical protein FWD44_06055 [Oscillospiraceae bacterium]|nr:hypothetical protein [Oscillospiraceae bacterium]
MIKILLLNLILFTTLSLVNCAGSAGAPTDPPSGNPSQNQTDPIPTPYPFDEALLEEGIFDGELDVNGKFTGWGVWIFYSTRYEGYFVDGLPNGEGILYTSNEKPQPFNPETHAYVPTTTYKGTFVNGYAHGLIIKTDYYEIPAGVHFYEVEMEMGKRDVIDLYCKCGAGDPHSMGGTVWAGVPPFTDIVHYHKDLAPPNSINN